MILYKYVSREAAVKILETGSIGFTQSSYFNDPFDTPSYPRQESESIEDRLFGDIKLMAKERLWETNTGVLSLTRTPTNPLMWAHYADKHRGVVLGFDMNEMGLTDVECNFIPAQYGNIIYVSTRPNAQFIMKPELGLEVGSTHKFRADHYEKLQRLFLHKPVCWAYEEEVRVLKCLKGLNDEGGSTQSGDFVLAEGPGYPLFCYKFTPSAVKEMIFGFRMDLQACEDLINHTSKRYPKLSISECFLQPDSYAVGTQAYTSPGEE